jgi:cytochrome c
MKSWMDTTIAAFLGLSTLAVASLPAAAQSGDASRGQRVFNQQCRACHTLDKGGAQTAGPNLNGVFGRKAGTAEGYAFSDAMKASGIVWDEATLTEYNRDPKGKVPGTKMVFNGVKQAPQLADLVAYLKEATK